MSLDKFLGTKPEERCSNPKCRKIIRKTDTKYELTVKDKKGVYCQPCGSAILGPREDREEPI